MCVSRRCASWSPAPFATWLLKVGSPGACNTACVVCVALTGRHVAVGNLHLMGITRALGLAASNEKEIMDLGGPQSLLSIALKYISNAAVVEAVAGAIRNLTFRSGKQRQWCAFSNDTGLVGSLRSPSSTANGVRCA